MGQMMGGAGGAPGVPGAPGAGGAPPDMASLLQVGHSSCAPLLLSSPAPLQAGQQLAQQMQQSNPELVEQLRRQMGGEDDTKYCYRVLHCYTQVEAGPSPLPPATLHSDAAADGMSSCCTAPAEVSCSCRSLLLLQKPAAPAEVCAAVSWRFYVALFWSDL